MQVVWDRIPELDLLPEIRARRPLDPGCVAPKLADKVRDRDNVFLREEVADNLVGLSDLCALLFGSCRQFQLGQVAVAVAQYGQCRAHPLVLTLGQREHFGRGERDHPHVPDVPVVALWPDACGRRHSRPLGPQPVAKFDDGGARSNNLWDKLRPLGTAAREQVVIPANNSRRRHFPVRVVVIDPVAVPEVEQRQVGIVSRHLGEIGARRRQHRRYRSQLRLEAQARLFPCPKVREGDPQEGVEVEARVALPRTQHLQIKAVAIEERLDRQEVGLLFARPRLDCHTR